MDPSIMKLLEDDEDETMHSGADVEAFTAALNRDIEGETSTSQPSDSDNSVLAQGSNHTSSQLFSQWKTSSQDESSYCQNKQDLKGSQQEEQHSSEMEQKQHGSGPESRQQQMDTSQGPNCLTLQQNQPQDDSQQMQSEQNILHFPQTMGMRNSEKIPVHIQEPDRIHNIDSESQCPKLQKTSNEQPMPPAQAINPMNRGKQVPLALLLPVLQPQLDKDRAMQLQTLYLKVKQNEISKDGFLQHMRSLVGDQMLKMAVFKLQTQQPYDSQMRQVSVHQSMGAAQVGTGTQVMNATSVPNFERQNSFSEPKRMQGGALSHLTNNSTLQQSSVHWQSSTTKEKIDGSPSSMTYVKQELIDRSNEQQHKSPLTTPQGSSSFCSVQVEQGNEIPGTSKDTNFEMQSSRMGFSTSTSMIPSMSSSTMNQLDPNISLSSWIPSAASTIGPGSNAKPPPKKPSIGQKKPLEAVGSLPALSSKKQKISGAFLDQSIEKLNDVTAVSGVNLREEEEQLFSGPKEDSRVSEASRWVVQEEEERLILQKLPLQKKLAEIMAKCGLKSISNDVEQCLSLCVEERMRGLINNLIRLSKQRVDIEKSKHQTLITSDVRQQIMIMNRKAWEEREKKQAEAEKLQKLNEPESAGVDGDKEKDVGRVKPLKANKEEDDKMRTTAANVAARAAVGGDDMLSKWQLMAEQARQKREGDFDAASGSQLGKDVSCKPLSTSGRNAKDNQEADKRGHSSAIATSGPGRILGRNQVTRPQTRVAHRIAIKDVISVFEREPQMSKSALIYRLYDKIRANAVAE
ncbi:hypothetical protein F0562_035829 [Nyssa sinensis]|uniref:RST domain-containing protein n=1 Tax=Nyssa sinensis TaxID=561372 RepID=A0A5J5ADZ1_9ASTE|nr:hypothetical protein F0562_035829 [Nyssa sinensis]